MEEDDDLLDIKAFLSQNNASSGAARHAPVPCPRSVRC
jgi:hypothetical protein